MRAIACIVIFAACSYSDPRLDNTRFRCDGGKPCPPGQTCAGGVCVAASHNGVACLTRPCTASEQCCDDTANPPHCIPLTDDCVGQSAFCDGAEDCTPGNRCCAVGVDQACAPDCPYIACQEAAEDCPTNQPNCCDSPSEPKPWKYCQLDPC